MEGSEVKFSDTTHGCSFCAMPIISLMAINGSSVLMARGAALYLNVLVGDRQVLSFKVFFKESSR